MKSFFVDLKQILSELTDNLNEVKVNAERVQTELAHAERTGKEIQIKINEFQVVAQPKIDKINELVEEISKKTN